jgi:hypothetical protein
VARPLPTRADPAATPRPPTTGPSAGRRPNTPRGILRPGASLRSLPRPLRPPPRPTTDPNEADGPRRVPPAAPGGGSAVPDRGRDRARAAGTTRGGAAARRRRRGDLRGRRRALPRGPRRPHAHDRAVRARPRDPLSLRADGMGIVFAVLASILWVLASSYAVGYLRGDDASEPDALLRLLRPLPRHGVRGRVRRRPVHLLHRLRAADGLDLPAGHPQRRRGRDRRGPQVPRLPARRRGARAVRAGDPDRADRRRDVRGRRVRRRLPRPGADERHLPAARGRLRHQGRADAAAPLAARRHGRPHPGVRPPARRRGRQGWRLRLRSADRLRVRPRGARRV